VRAKPLSGGVKSIEAPGVSAVCPDSESNVRQTELLAREDCCVELSMDEIDSGSEKPAGVSGC
jgi:hypothetical protein